jgi:zinc protease
MMFKGTPTFPSGELDRALARLGGQWNAYTSFDFTAYYQTMSASDIGLSLVIEADRMQNSLFDPAEVEAERTVIISERQGLENHPTFLLSEEVRAAAFRVHPYHHTVIGNMADLETITREDLYRHYRSYYCPGNAVVVVAGDLNGERMLAQVEERFGRLERGPTIRPVNSHEPEQRGERRVNVEGDGDTAYLLMSYRAPNVSDPDYFPLVVLGSALLGDSDGVAGGSTTNKSSRLYKALVETELAAGVDGGLSPSIDPALYSISATVRAPERGRNRSPIERLDLVESAIDAEIARLLESHPVTETELACAIKRAKASFAFGSDSVTDQGSWLGLSQVVAGSHTWFGGYLDNLQGVTLDDVARVAARYLDRRRRTVGRYIPGR